jgi:hypothetical protein
MNQQIKKLAEQAGFGYDDLEVDQTMIMIIERFAELVRQNERELNAKLCEEYQFDFARAIREGHRL